MKPLHLLPIGNVEEPLLRSLKTTLPQVFHTECRVLPTVLDPVPAFHGERSQYHSSELLQLMRSFAGPQSWRLLGVAAVDLYIPILTFVFGEAQVGGPCAVVSYHRLRQESYGLPPDYELLGRRLLTESIHEVGHTMDLTHCDDYRCAMASSHSVEGIDLKESALCANCRLLVGPTIGSGVGR